MIYQQYEAKSRFSSGNLAALAAQVVSWRESPEQLLINLKMPQSPICSVVEKLQLLCELSDNWDSHQAKPIEYKAAVNAIRLFCEVMYDQTPIPAIVPTVRGNIQLEWHKHGIDLEVEISECGNVIVSFEDSKTGKEDDWTESFNYGVARLREYMETLTLRDVENKLNFAA